MKLKYKFSKRTVMDENLFIPLNEAALAVSGIAYTNEAAAFLMEQLDVDRTEEELLRLLLDEFDTDEATARTDIARFLDKLRSLQLLDE